jgi:molybdopterin synthase catalytic subunit
MDVLAVVGHSETGKTTLVERLVGELAGGHTVGTIKHLTHAPDVDTEGKDTARHRAAGARTTYGVTDADGWFATGTTVPPAAMLARLAPDHEVAIVEGYTRSRLPKVVLGDRDDSPSVPEPVLARAPRADAVDVGAVLDALGSYPGYGTRASLVAGLHSRGSGLVGTVSGRIGGPDGALPPPAQPRPASVRDRDRTDDPDGRDDGDGPAAVANSLAAQSAVDEAALVRQPAYFPGETARFHVGVRAADRSAVLGALDTAADRVADAPSLTLSEVTLDTAAGTDRTDADRG